MDPVHILMDPVHGRGPWTRGPCFVLSRNFQLLFVTERTQLNATHAQLLEKLRPIALAETSRFLAIPVVRIPRNLAKKIDQRPRERSITKNLNFDIGNF